MARRSMIHTPATDYTNPRTGQVRIITRCGSDLPVHSSRLARRADLHKLRDAGRKVCHICAG